MLWFSHAPSNVDGTFPVKMKTFTPIVIKRQVVGNMHVVQAAMGNYGYNNFTNSFVTFSP